MQLKLKSILFFILIMFFLWADNTPLFAQIDEEPLFLFRGARPLGLGNAYEAIADDVHALYYNPAGLVQNEDKIIHILIARGRATDDFIDEAQTFSDFFDDTVSPLVDSDNPLTDPRLEVERQRLVDRAEEILAKELGFDAGGPSLGLVEPFMLGEHRAALGFSFYTQAVGGARIVETGLPWSDRVMAMFDNPIVYRVTLQATIATALSVEIPVGASFLDKLNLGTTLRLIRRGTFTDQEDPFAIEDMLDSDTFRDRYFDIDDNDDFIDFARQNVDSKSGYSLDLGTLFFPTDGVRVGIVWRNALSNMNVGYDDIDGNEITDDRPFPPNFVVSAAVKPLDMLDSSDNIRDKIDATFAISIDNPNGDDRLGDFELDKFTDHIHLGAEIVLIPKSDFSLGLRAGDNQGFATFGATVRLLKALELDVVRYGNLEADWWGASIGLTF